MNYCLTCGIEIGTYNCDEYLNGCSICNECKELELSSIYDYVSIYKRTNQLPTRGEKSVDLSRLRHLRG